MNKRFIILLSVALLLVRPGLRRCTSVPQLTEVLRSLCHCTSVSLTHGCCVLVFITCILVYPRAAVVIATQSQDSIVLKMNVLLVYGM